MFNEFFNEQRKHENKKSHGLQVYRHTTDSDTIYIGKRESPRYTRICGFENKLYLELELKSRIIIPFRETFQKRDITKFYFHALDEITKKIQTFCDSLLTREFIGLVYDTEEELEELRKFYIINSPTSPQNQIDKALNLCSPKMMG